MSSGDEQEKRRILNVYNSYKQKQYQNIKWSNKFIGNQYIFNERLQTVKKIILDNNIDLSNAKILEIGCAGGDVIDLLIKVGAQENNIYGIDIRKEKLQYVKNKFPDCHFQIMDVKNMKYPENHFDLITAFTLFSSILDSEFQLQSVKEICKVLKPGGKILLYDFRFNNPFNNNVRAMKLKDIEKLFTALDIDFHLITLFPPLSRKLGFTAKFLYPLLSKLSLLKTHYLCIIHGK